MGSAILFNGLLYAAFLFLPAGTWRWPHAWIFLAALLAMSIHQQISVGRVHRALLDERAGLPIRRGRTASSSPRSWRRSRRWWRSSRWTASAGG